MNSKIQIYFKRISFNNKISYGIVFPKGIKPILRTAIIYYTGSAIDKHILDNVYFHRIFRGQLMIEFDLFSDAKAMALKISVLINGHYGILTQDSCTASSGDFQA